MSAEHEPVEVACQPFVCIDSLRNVAAFLLDQGYPLDAKNVKRCADELVAHRTDQVAVTPLIEAVTLARNAFEGFAALHRDEGTPDGTAKAKLNQELAVHMNAALKTIHSRLSTKESAMDTEHTQPPNCDSKPVDVLAVMSEWRAGQPFPARNVMRMRENLDAAISAIAELIKADIEFDEARDAIDVNPRNIAPETWNRYVTAMQRRDTALSAARGQSSAKEVG